MLGKFKLKSFDAYAKGIDGVYFKTTVGGICRFLSMTACVDFLHMSTLPEKVTLLSLLLIATLTLNEVRLLFTSDVTSSMSVDIRTQKGKLPIHLDISFPELPCPRVNIDTQNSDGESRFAISDGIRKKAIGRGGCRVYGTIVVDEVAGNFHIMVGHEKNGAYEFTLNELAHFRVSHKIHHLSFGDPFPNMVAPLNNVEKTLRPGGAPAKFDYVLDVVPTKFRGVYGGTIHSYQYSVSESTSELNFMSGMLEVPGLWFSYDFSAIMIEYKDGRPTIFQLMTKLCAIIGGVYVVAGLIDRFIHSAWKKTD